MLLLTFQRPGHSKSLGPALEFKLRGAELFIDSEKAPIAQYVAAYWTFAGERWAYAACQTRVSIQLEDDDGRLIARIGPRPSCRLREKFIFAGRERVLTLLPAQRLWQQAGSTNTGSVVRVLPYVPAATLAAPADMPRA
jgi:hypothetical protein